MIRVMHVECDQPQDLRKVYQAVLAWPMVTVFGLQDFSSRFDVRFPVSRHGQDELGPLQDPSDEQMRASIEHLARRVNVGVSKLRLSFSDAQEAAHETLNTGAV